MAYSDEEIKIKFTAILERVSNGEAVRTVLKDKEMPSSQTFFKWLSEDGTKSKQYAHACEERADIIFEDILHIADDTSKDSQTVNLEGIEVEQLNTENIQRSRLRVDARKWMASKLNPKKYGNKLDLSVEDKTLSKEERNARLLELKAKLKDN